MQKKSMHKEENWNVFYIFMLTGHRNFIPKKARNYYKKPSNHRNPRRSSINDKLYMSLFDNFIKCLLPGNGKKLHQQRKNNMCTHTLFIAQKPLSVWTIRTTAIAGVTNGKKTNRQFHFILLPTWTLPMQSMDVYGIKLFVRLCAGISWWHFFPIILFPSPSVYDS